MTDENAGATLRMTVSYHGAPFCGFARQPGQLTVQGDIERALATLFAHPVETVCAGRTDAGVHALGQVVSFSVDEDDIRDRTPESIARSLNALTHEAISVREVKRERPGFSARFDAVEREYRYYICLDAQPPLVMADFSWVISKPLDIEAMVEASRCLIGEHDFKSFCQAASAKGKPTCRCVNRIDFDRCDIMGADMLVITITGNAFLHNMVRTIIGTLALVGRHQREIDWVSQVLAACDRRAAGQCAPAKGLLFWQVRY